MKNKMKRDTRMGFEMRTIDLRQDGLLTRSTDWAKENVAEIVMLALFAGMVYSVGMLMSTTAEAVDLYIEYADMEQAETVEQYQDRQVMEALIEQRMEAVGETAEQPPYWTAPVETK